jgi:hypothetical protein
MRMKLEATDGAVLVAHRPKAAIRQWSSFANKDSPRWNGWPLYKVSGNRLARSDGQGANPLLVPLSISEYSRAASLANDEIVEAQVNKIANPTARVKYHGKDRIGTKIVSEFDLPQQFPYLSSLQSFGSQRRPLQFLDGLAGIGGDMALLDQPAEESADRGQIAVDGGNGLTSVPPKVRSEIRDVTGGDSADDEPFAVGCREPLGKLTKVEDVPASRAKCIIVRVQVRLEQVVFDFANQNALEMVYRRIIHRLTLQI